MSKTIIISNRLPVQLQISEGKIEAIPSVGGLATGMKSVHQEGESLWIGWSGLTREEIPESLEPEIDAALADHGCSKVPLTQKEVSGFYFGFSNRTIWPLFHYFTEHVTYSEVAWKAYVKINRLYAEKILEILQEGDILWVHDYHLIPLAQELRRAGITQPIGFFLHVPFPSYEAFRAVPGHEFLLRALTAYDVVGFHTPRDLKAFRTCLEEPIVDATFIDDTRVRVGDGELIADVFPIGIDVDEIQKLSSDSQSMKTVQRMVSSLDGRQLLIGVDRLDYSKGLKLRLRSYERLLERYPNAQRNVTFIQIAPPTRTGVRAYDEIRSELEQTSGHINGRFAESDWVPIRYLNKGVDRKPLMGFLRNADVGLVTPVRDGMNLVAKEYVACRTDSTGALVLSEFTGSAEQLGDAWMVNPYDIAGLKESIRQATRAGEEEHTRRMTSMRHVVFEQNVQRWVRDFLSSLEEPR